MVAGDKMLIAYSPQLTFRQPLDCTAPKTEHIYWYIYDNEPKFECISSIRLFMAAWVIPFLDEYRDVHSFVRGYEKQDERLCHHRTIYIYVSAAYLLLGQPARAMEVLEKRFGKAGPRRQYAKAFEYVASRLGKD